MDEEPVGSNPLPQDIQDNLAKFLEWMDEHYSFKNGTTAMFWYLSSIISKQLEDKKEIIDV